MRLLNIFGVLLVATYITAGPANACHEVGHDCDGKIIAVSWGNFEQERWKSDEAAMRIVIDAAGNNYISTDAQGSLQKQVADIEGLVVRPVDVIIVVALDAEGIRPALRQATEAGVKLISYDVLVRDPSVLYVGFDDRAAGRMMAAAVVQSGYAGGNFAFINGDRGDPGSKAVYEGMKDILQQQFDSGKIRNVCESYTDSWSPDLAKKNMKDCLVSTGNNIDVVMSGNDALASGAISALNESGLSGKVQVTGQSSMSDALNRVALGTQLVSVWRDPRLLGRTAAEMANKLASGEMPSGLPGVSVLDPGGDVDGYSVLVTPSSITKDNLRDVIDSGWVSREIVCSGVAGGTTAACN